MMSSEILHHKKTGGLYEVLFRGAVIHSDVPLSDDAPVTVCRRIPDGQIVARFGPTPRGSFEVLHHSRLQTDVSRSDGTEVVVYRALNGGPVWVRPTSEMDDGRFEPADAVGAPPPVPSPEVERMVDRLIEAAKTYAEEDVHPSWWEKGSGSALDKRRTALLSRITLSPAPSDQGMIQRAREAAEALAYLTPHARTADTASISLNAGKARASVITVLKALRALQSPSTGDGAVPV